MATRPLQPGMAQEPSPLTVLILPLGADTGGVNWGMTRAFRDTDWTVHSMIGGGNYIGYPADLRHDRDLLWYWWNRADVVHLSHDVKRLRRIAGYRLPPRPVVMHYHGTGFREAPVEHLRRQDQWFPRSPALVSTLDLWLLAPERTEWLPAPYDLQWLARFPSGS